MLLPNWILSGTTKCVRVWQRTSCRLWGSESSIDFTSQTIDFWRGEIRPNAHWDFIHLDDIFFLLSVISVFMYSFFSSWRWYNVVQTFLLLLQAFTMKIKAFWSHSCNLTDAPSISIDDRCLSKSSISLPGDRELLPVFYLWSCSFRVLVMPCGPSSVGQKCQVCSGFTFWDKDQFVAWIPVTARPG